MPDPSINPYLLGNLRRARLEIEELGLQLDEVLARVCFESLNPNHPSVSKC